MLEIVFVTADSGMEGAYRCGKSSPSRSATGSHFKSGFSASTAVDRQISGSGRYGHRLRLPTKLKYHNILSLEK